MAKSSKPAMARVRKLLALYESMVTIRRAETRLQQMFAEDEIPGFIHLSIGQEAVAAGVAAALTPTDSIASTHRGHGHALAKGVALDGFFMEILGRKTGVCGGRGGSMHVADMSVGMLGANGIVGAGLPLALGSALAHQVKGTDNVAVAFFGDGAMSEGVLHECLNMAWLWKLPLMFVCENNGWAEFSPTERSFSGDPKKLAAAFGVPMRSVDGNDAEAVATEAGRFVSAMRTGGGPRFLECRTERIRGHFEGDPQKYRDPREISGLGRRDPIARCEQRLRALNVGRKDILAVSARIDADIEAALAAARAAEPPDPITARAGVYATTGDA